MARNRAFVCLCLFCTGMAILILTVLLLSIFIQGIGYINLDFLRNLNSSDPTTAGVYTALIGTIIVCAICAATAIPLGVGTAILIEEFRPRAKGTGHIPGKAWAIGWGATAVILLLTYFVAQAIGSGGFFIWVFGLALCAAAFLLVVHFIAKESVLRFVHGIVETNIRNLAGVPSIVYGILGVTAFATMFGLFGDMGAGRFAIGQSWYDQYVGEDRNSYYIPVSGPVDKVEKTPAAADMTYYAKPGSSETVSLTFLPEDEAKERRDSIEDEMDAFDDALRDAIDATRGARGRGPATIDAATAEAIVDEAMGAGRWESDPAELRKDLIPLVAAIDGLDRRDLSRARREVINTAVDREYRTRLTDTLMVGAMPVRTDRKAWYYLSLPLGRGVMAGGLTLMLVVLPIVIVASQEALKAVPDSYRQGALAMGATRWQAVSKTALPAAIPGICTGTILAISRAIGEAAPLLVLGGVGFITATPQHAMDRFAAMPMQIFQWLPAHRRGRHHHPAGRPAQLQRPGDLYPPARQPPPVERGGRLKAWPG
jgi:phosphate transport system permease protein